MALAREQVVAFRELMGALVAYARRQPASPTSEAGGAQHGGRARQASPSDAEISQALDTAWNTPGMLEHFIAHNPAGLTAAQLETLATWQWRLSDTFVCLEATPERLTVMNGERIFTVTALGRPFTSMVRVVPSVVRLTLLPFAGHIVTDGRIIHRLDHLDPAAFPLIMDTLALLAEDGFVETALELIEYAAGRMVSS